MIQILGVRHHGPGSARSALEALKQQQPDLLLVEGPADAEAILPLLLDDAMRPPIALLLYAEGDPSLATYFPFAIFSPEYQTIRFALQNGIPVRLMDLPQCHMLMLPKDQSALDIDPLYELATSAGYDDAERWWDALVEQRQDSTELFAAILEAMSALREELEIQNPLDEVREAYMRQTLHQAQHDGFQNIAIVCGAWHAPAMLTAGTNDAALLASLDRIDVAATWVPWTYSRLARQSGYGAGMQSPGWYHHLWHTPNAQEVAVGWLTAAAQHLRKHDLDASTAQIIDAARLVETLAGMRGRSLPDLHDLNEAALSVICHGNEAPMKVIWEDLIVGQVMGSVPNSVPMVPLQRDFQDEVTRLGLELTADELEIVLDLRDELHRAISHLCYRLHLLDIHWGTREDADFISETWILEWQPTLVIQLVEKSVWGNTILEAGTAFAQHQAQEAASLPILTQLVHDVLLADLPQAIPLVVQQLENEAATTGDILQLMSALPALADVLLYGDVRHTQSDVIRRVVEGMTTRILIGLPAECIVLDEAAAASMLDSIIACDVALRTLDNPIPLQDWHMLLARMIDQAGTHGLIRGRCCRIVLDANFITQEKAVQHLRLALAPIVLPEEAAAWLRGFLMDSGIILVHQDHLLNVIDQWVMTLTPDEFDRMLPLLRRTFATFEEPEIRHIGRRINGRPLTQAIKPVRLDSERAAHVDKTMNELLGKDDDG
jgi:hypothetical protein